ncbi:hypothetical protein Ahy_A01g003602 isoform B [Arachis hypogaea]|uniref:Uncharacterized protein n=1 Tax=Arachis hypogaea TaxID=3818 RepID=A0A445ETX4_ARAHY|nr:hypothetical protein Ahy_A01g003602 isoform B [Arachis hypogaea]
MISKKTLNSKICGKKLLR